MPRFAWMALALAAAGCKSDQGLEVRPPEFGPPNIVDFETPRRTDRVMQGRLRTASSRRWVDDTVSDPEVLFAQMSVMGTDGHWVEKGRAAAYTAVELLRTEENLGFVRPDAAMHMTVVSDENDESGESPIGRDEFVTWLRGYRSGRNMVSFSSIVAPVAGCPDIGSPGTEYSAVSAELGGVVWPICDPEWTQVLDEIGFLAVGLDKEFFLSARPIVSSIEVSIELPDGSVQVFERAAWTYDAVRNSITFVDLVPDPLSTVIMDYEIRSQDEQGLEDGGPGER
jgi:hypothetical protein